MLVLSRKRNESILIDDHIRIIVVDVRDDKVRLGIEAPVEMAVHRHEIYEAIQRAAMQDIPPDPRQDHAAIARSIARNAAREEDSKRNPERN